VLHVIWKTLNQLIKLLLLLLLLLLLFIYLLTQHSTVLLEKLTGVQLVKKLPAFYGTRRFITVLTSGRHLSLLKKLVRDASPRNTPPFPPPENQVGEYFTSVLFCLQRKHLAYEYFLTIEVHGEELLAPRPTPKLEDHHLSALRACLFNLFAATLQIGGRSSSRHLRRRQAMVTGTHKHGHFTHCVSKTLPYRM
jgi:hypothetical protein